MWYRIAKKIYAELARSEENLRLPHQMTRAEFEQTARALLHGTAAPFSQFGKGTVKDRYNNDAKNPDRFYFTDNPSIAQQFSDISGPNYKQLNYDKWFRINENILPVDDPNDPQVQQIFINAIKGQMNKGWSLKYVDYEPDSPTGNKLVNVQNPSDIDFYNYSEDGDARLYKPGFSPRVIETNIYGNELDLTKLHTIPKDFWRHVMNSEPKKELPFESGQWNHEYIGTRLSDYMRKNGYGKAVVPDGYESGGQSVIGLTDYIGHNRDPHREFVENAIKNGTPIPDQIMNDYPDLMPRDSYMPSDAWYRAQEYA